MDVFVGSVEYCTPTVECQNEALKMFAEKCIFASCKLLAYKYVARAEQPKCCGMGFSIKSSQVVQVRCLWNTRCTVVERANDATGECGVEPHARVMLAEREITGAGIRPVASLAAIKIRLFPLPMYDSAHLFEIIRRRMLIAVNLAPARRMTRLVALAASMLRSSRQHAPLTSLALSTTVHLNMSKNSPGVGAPI